MSAAFAQAADDLRRTCTELFALKKKGVVVRAAAQGTLPGSAFVVAAPFLIPSPFAARAPSPALAAPPLVFPTCVTRVSAALEPIRAAPSPHAASRLIICASPPVQTDADVSELLTRGALLCQDIKASSRDVLLGVQAARDRVQAAMASADADNLTLDNLRYERSHLLREISKCKASRCVRVCVAVCGFV